MRDVVFMVRTGREYEELRHALRSVAANLPHGKVWVFGGEPRWLVNAIHVPVRQGPVGHRNTARAMAAIAANRAISDEFYWFHDDMYVMEPVELIPRLWRCEWGEWAAGAAKRREPHGRVKTAATEEAFAAFGITPRYSYELHVPMPVERDELRRCVAEVQAWRPEVLTQVQKRSLYGNWSGSYGGERLAADVKFYRATSPEWVGPFASSADLALGMSPLGRVVRERFSEPCRYEKTRELVDASTKPRGREIMAGHLAGGRRVV